MNHFSDNLNQQKYVIIALAQYFEKE